MYNDYPLLLCVEEAQKLRAKGMDIYQKWTCAHCGSRQTMAEKNQFYASGKCEECGAISLIKNCNYMVHASGASAVDALMKDMTRRKE